MKKVFYVFFLMLISLTTVKAYTTVDFAKAVNDGDSTKELIKDYKKNGCKVTIEATSTDNSVDVVYTAYCEETKTEYIDGENKEVTKTTYDLTGNINYSINEEGILISSVDRTPENIESDPFYDKVLQLTPYWGVEMTSKYTQISKYIDKNHDGKVLETFKTIFDKCYMAEMGVCYTVTPGTVSSNYIGKLQLDDTGADYALKYLKKEQKEINTKNLTFKVAIAAVVLLLLIIICKSAAPVAKPKPLKY